MGVEQPKMSEVKKYANISSSLLSSTLIFKVLMFSIIGLNQVTCPCWQLWQAPTLHMWHKYCFEFFNCQFCSKQLEKEMTGTEWKTAPNYLHFPCLESHITVFNGKSLCMKMSWKKITLTEGQGLCYRAKWLLSQHCQNCLQFRMGETKKGWQNIL